MSVKARTNLIVDIAVLIAFLVANNPSLTGIPVHEWFAVAGGVVLIVHMVFHWDWVVNVSKTFFNKLIHESRFNYLVDALLLVDYVVVFLSGLAISRSFMVTLGISLPASPAWREFHSLSANLALVLTGLHFAMHWRWFVNALQRYVISPIRSVTEHPAAGRLAAQPVKAEKSK
ncbi:MAG TPA: DUF4405 domain-containing protein [Anaerolineales bacterium]|nr:DUF4405 domain-containing protein [Anaerolineales bacterium]